MMAKTALVVDNDFFFVEFLAELLEAKGYQVIKAYDGKEGISKLEEQGFDLMFADIIMPKIDGKQLIKFARSKYPIDPFPIVALSGVILEEMDRLDEVGADYYIAKGPMEKMAAEIQTVVDKIENKTVPSSAEERVFLPDHLIPSQTADELIRTADFYRAINKGIDIGILVLDRDSRILSANPAALELINRPDHKVLNQPVKSILSGEGGGEAIKMLKKLVVQPELKSLTFSADIHSRSVRVKVSLFRIDNEIAGWILAMEGKDSWEEQA